MVIKRDNEVNRDIDPQTAEGHLRVRVLEDSEDAGKRNAIRVPQEALDDEAEGHRRMP